MKRITWTLTATFADDALEEEDLEAIREDLEDEARAFNGHGVILGVMVEDVAE